MAVRQQALLAARALLVLALLPFGLAHGAEPAAIPAPAADLPARAGAPETVVLAGGCFWGVQAVFQHVIGVKRAVSGYSGGSKATADYETVGTGRTGHAEAVEITYDPRAVSLGKLLQIFFAVTHDPTELDRQGPDVGPQYRSAIFVKDEDQKRIAAAYIAQLDGARAFRRPIATRIEPLGGFYAAEDYHQDYATLHPDSPYVAHHDLPKIDALKRAFPGLFREKPILVKDRAATN